MKEKSFFFISGLTVSIPFTLFFERISQSLCVLLPVFYANVCAIAIFAPFIEEFAKAYPLFYRHGETEKSIFLLGLLVGLGFGIGEFYIYVFLYGVPFFYRITPVLTHAALTSIVCYGIAKNKPIRFYLLGAGLHLVNNYFAILGGRWNFMGGAAMGMAVLISYYLYTKTSEAVTGLYLS